jgi:DnaJ-class molecular chaperone
MVWRTCQTCRGKMKVPDPKNPSQTKVCPACRGEGGANTQTTP